MQASSPQRASRSWYRSAREPDERSGKAQTLPPHVTRHVLPVRQQQSADSRHRLAAPVLDGRARARVRAVAWRPSECGAPFRPERRMMRQMPRPSQIESIPEASPADPMHGLVDGLEHQIDEFAPKLVAPHEVKCGIPLAPRPVERKRSRGGHGLDRDELPATPLEESRASGCSSSRASRSSRMPELQRFVTDACRLLRSQNGLC